ncbi:MAG: replicative DNA helicase [Armatimonadetes bacterium]|nr:replicative DNA helicase [Armatimonadota bacterium]
MRSEEDGVAKDGRRLAPEPPADRLPPQDLEAEQATLGAMLVDEGAATRALAITKAEDFYREAHRIIFGAMERLAEHSQAIDLVTVGAELRRQGQLEAIGGAEYLTALIDQVPTTAHIVRYASIVADKALLRRLITVGGEIQALAFEDPDEVDMALDAAEQKIYDIAHGRSTSDFQHISPLVNETYQKLEQLSQQRNYLSGVGTGLIEFDNMTSGLQNSELIIIAGRPSMGKTSLLVNNIAMHAAVKLNIPVAIFSLEMSAHQLAEMLLCGYARVNSWRLRRGKTNTEDWVRIGMALKELPHAPIYIDDTPAISILEMRSKARRLKAQHDIGLICVDYLQLASGGGRYEDSRHQEISIVARSLKSMARELDVPVVVGSQLSRNVERREDKRPILSDLAESGSIEAEADLVCFLYREEYYKRKKDAKEVEAETRRAAETGDDERPQGPDIAELIIAKHRNGPVGTVKLAFHDKMRIFDTVDTSRNTEDYS